MSHLFLRCIAGSFDWVKFNWAFNKKISAKSCSVPWARIRYILKAGSGSGTAYASEWYAGSASKSKSRIRVRIGIKVKIRELWRLKMEPWRDDTLTMEAWRLKMELWMVCKPVFAASHHFAESRIRIQIWIPFKVRRTQIRIKVSRIRIYLVTVLVNKHCTMYMDTKKDTYTNIPPPPPNLTWLLKSLTISTIM